MVGTFDEIVSQLRQMEKDVLKELNLLPAGGALDLRLVFGAGADPRLAGTSNTVALSVVPEPLGLSRQAHRGSESKNDLSKHRAWTRARHHHGRARGRLGWTDTGRGRSP